jgi:hypothetical protein
MSVSSFMRHAQARVVLAPYMIFIVKFVKKKLQLGAVPIPCDVPVPSVDDLADQVADVLDFFGYCISISASVQCMIILL